MMGDKFQLGPFKDVIVAARQRVTGGTKFFEKFSGAAFCLSVVLLHVPEGVGLWIGSCGLWVW